MRFLAICGSLQRGSSNAAVLRTAQALAPAGVDVELFEDLADLPHFNPDLDREPGPPEVEAFRRRLRESEAVMIATPEYAHGMPGALKDALDWLVGSGELYGKLVLVLTGSPRPEGGAHAREMLERTLGAQGARVVASSAVWIRNQDKGKPMLSESASVEAVKTALRALINATEAGGGLRSEGGDQANLMEKPR